MLPICDLETNWEGEHSNDLIVVVRVTNRCTMACLYCGFSRELRLPTVEIDAVQLMAFGDSLERFCRSTGRKALVSWLGGEPYEWSQLWPVSQYFSEHLGLSLGVTTNGLGLAKSENRHRTLEHFEQLTISVDGPASVHDWQRSLAGGYKRVRDLVRLLRSEDVAGRLLLRANMVLTRHNIERFQAACLDLADWGFDELTFNALGGNERPDFHSENKLLRHQVVEFREKLPEVRSLLAAQGLRIRGTTKYLERIENSAAHISMSISDCQPGSEFLFIDERGRVAPCSFTTDCYSVELDQLKGAADIAALPDNLADLRRRFACHACGDCHATHMFAKFGKADTNVPAKEWVSSAIQ